jgi:hypothetical protein
MANGKRALLGVVLAAIAVSAALGIAAIFVSDFGETLAKVLATSAAVTGAGIFVLALVLALERHRLGLLPAFGIVATLVGFGLVVVGAWAEIDDETFWKVAGTVLWIASWTVLASLLALARLAPRYRWSFLAAVAASLVLLVLIVIALWGDISSGDFWRAFGVVAVVTAALTLTVPVLHRASRPDLAAPGASGRVGFCPRCGRSLRAESAVGACRGCGARFEVRFLS